MDERVPSPVAGFSLVEVMMAALLLGVGILLVLGAERRVRQLGEGGARHRRAVESAASALDSARAGCSITVPAVAVPVSAAIVHDGHVRHAGTLLACGGP